jgi:putative glutamine amidotransferase
MLLTIGITNCEKWEDYKRWIEKGHSPLNIIKLSPGENAAERAALCAGIILTGGCDVHPEIYGKPEYVEKYNLNDFDRNRDTFELALIKETESHKIPLLGICRGLQIANVYFKGTLVPDLPSMGKTAHTGTNKKEDSRHSVKVKEGSLLESVTGKNEGIVNSHHHQSADAAGKGLIVTATSEDGVVEGMEKEKKNGNAFFLLVQCHPERMEEHSPFSEKLRDAFFNAAIAGTTAASKPFFHVAP